MWKIKHTNNQCVVPFLYIELTLSETVARYFLGDFIVNRLIFSAFIDIRNLLFFQRSQIGYEHGFVDIVLGEGN